jgi:hypothetical protein
MQYTKLHVSTSNYTAQTRYTETKYCSLVRDLLQNLRPPNVLTLDISLLRQLKLCNNDINQNGDTRVEAGSNTSTVTLRVVGGDEKGSLKCETVI